MKKTEALRTSDYPRCLGRGEKIRDAEPVSHLWTMFSQEVGISMVSTRKNYYT